MFPLSLYGVFSSWWVLTRWSCWEFGTSDTLVLGLKNVILNPTQWTSPRKCSKWNWLEKINSVSGVGIWSTGHARTEYRVHLYCWAADTNRTEYCTMYAGYILLRQGQNWKYKVIEYWHAMHYRRTREYSILVWDIFLISGLLDFYSLAINVILQVTQDRSHAGSDHSLQILEYHIDQPLWLWIDRLL